MYLVSLTAIGDTPEHANGPKCFIFYYFFVFLGPSGENEHAREIDHKLFWRYRGRARGVGFSALLFLLEEFYQQQKHSRRVVSRS